MYELHIHAFYPHVSRGYADQQNSQPVICLIYAEGCLENEGDTVGEPPSAEICVSHMPAWKAKKLGKLLQEKVLLEL
jgi:hypothetical protein